MLSSTSEGSQRLPFLYVSFGNSFGLASVQSPHRACRLRLLGAPDKPCGGGHTDANSKTVAIRYMIENKLVPLHYES